MVDSSDITPARIDEIIKELMESKGKKIQINKLDVSKIIGEARNLFMEDSILLRIEPRINVLGKFCPAAKRSVT